MRKLLFVIPLFAFLCSCSPQKQLARLLEKHPELHRDSIVVFHDTIIRPGVRDSIYITNNIIDSLQAVASTTPMSEQNSSKATSVVAGNATAILSATSNGFWLKAEQKSDTVYIDIEKEVPVYLTEIKEVEKPLSKWQHFCLRMGWIFIVLILLGMVFQLIRFYNKPKTEKL